MKKYLLAGVLILLFAIPLAAMQKESVKIKLPDGVYMYDSEVRRQKDGTDRVGFEKYFVVHNNNIYGSIEAYEKFGLSKLNALFGGGKKYKILCGGEVVGTKNNLRFEKEEGADLDDAYIFSDTSYNTQDIKEGPAYWEKSIKIIIPRMGSAVKCLAVPEEYKEIPKKVYTTIPQEEVDKIAKLTKEKLLPLVINRKEVKQYKIKATELHEERIDLLDKISDHKGDLYIGIYRYIFKQRGSYEFQIVFSAKQDKLYVITSEYDDETLCDQVVTIHGMLDFDGCGVEELFIEKICYEEDAFSLTKEIYKQKSDGNWFLIKKIKD